MLVLYLSDQTIYFKKRNSQMESKERKRAVIRMSEIRNLMSTKDPAPDVNEISEELGISVQLIRKYIRNMIQLGILDNSWKDKEIRPEKKDKEKILVFDKIIPHILRTHGFILKAGELFILAENEFHNCVLRHLDLFTQTKPLFITHKVDFAKILCQKHFDVVLLPGKLNSNMQTGGDDAIKYLNERDPIAALIIQAEQIIWTNNELHAGFNDRTNLELARFFLKTFPERTLLVFGVGCFNENNICGLAKIDRKITRIVIPTYENVQIVRERIKDFGINEHLVDVVKVPRQDAKVADLDSKRSTPV
jgi:hypothetical protein